MSAFRLTDDINLNIDNKEYNPIEVLIEWDMSDMSDLSDYKEPSDSYTTLVYKIKIEVTLDKICKPFVGKKLT